MTEPLPQAPVEYDRVAFDQALTSLDTRLRALERAVAVGYEVTNPVLNRSLDVSAATLGDLREVVGTLIVDLQAAGRLG